MKIPKLIIPLLIGTLICAGSNAQVADTIPHNPFKPDKEALRQQYLEKARSLRSIGIPLSVAGIVAWIVGAQGTLYHYDLFTGEGTGYVVLLATGIAATITGTVLMIRSGRYQSEAKFLLEEENLSQRSRLPIKGNLVSLGFVIPFK
ncbi:MAG: hypothetical protein ACHQET_06280 [Chitinophagales bacterium]